MIQGKILFEGTDNANQLQVILQKLGSINKTLVKKLNPNYNAKIPTFEKQPMRKVSLF